MTLQVDQYGPSSTAHTSPSFVATVGGLGSHVYSWARTAEYETRDWATNDTVRACWIKFGSDETAQVTISAIAGAITSFDIQPRNVATLPTIVGGDLVFTLPRDTTVRIIINGDRRNPLHVFAEPLSDAPPDDSLVNWNDLALDVYSIDYVNNEITFANEHGLEPNDRIIFQQDAGEPATELTAIGLVQYRPYLVDVTSTNRITLRELGTEEGDEAVNLTDGGTSLLLSAHKTSYGNTSAPLYFPAGVHVVGRIFDLGDGCTFYADWGAILIGGFEMRNRSDMAATGPGSISGEHVTYEAIADLQWSSRTDYAPIAGYDDLDGYASNRIEGLTIFASPFWSICGGVWSARNVQLISGWTANTDGFSVVPRSPSDRRSEIVDCFSWSGDDNARFFAWCDHLVTGCFLVNSSGCNLHGHYWALNASTDYTVTIDDIDLINLTKAGTVIPTLGEGYGSNGFLVRTWMDGWASSPNNGHYNVTLNDIRVWEEVGCRLLSLENKPYPWGVGEPGSPDLSRDQYGQIAYWTLSNWTVEETPYEISRIIGRDGANTPHDLTFTDIVIGGVQLTTATVEDFFLINSYPYNLTFESVVIQPEPVTDAGQLWAAVVASYNAADLVSLTNINSAETSTITTEVGEDAAQGVIDLWPLYAQVEYDSTSTAHVEVAKRAVIAMLWQRGGTAATIAKVEWDDVFGDTGLLTKVRRTGPRGRRGPASNSPYQSSTGLSNGRPVQPWSDRDALPRGVLPVQRPARYP